MSKTVNKRELAEVLGKTERAITDWQEETPALPIAKRGARGQEHEYDTAAVIDWLVERALAKAGKAESQRDREARLRADLLEFELAEKRGTMVPADQVGPIWEARVLAAAFYMSSRHSRLAGMLEATPGIEAKRALLKQEDQDFLSKLGVDGKRMQEEVDKLLERLSADEAAAFLRRVAGNDDQRGNGGTAQAG
jgi:phage terminase Nu1 subunit (DNA packaging protein)